MSDPASKLSPVRLDKWLWCVRLYKTRSQAADACKLKRVLMDGNEVKPSRELHVGDVFQIQQEDMVKVIQVKAPLHHRVAGKLVPDYLTDLTPAEVYEAAKARRQALSLAPAVAPAFRPNKHDRELIKRLFEPNE